VTVGLSPGTLRAWSAPGVLIVLLALVPVSSTLLGISLFERVAIEMLINVVLVVGLQIFVGNSGIISFGHAAFMGIGAYAGVLVTLPPGMKATLLPDLYAPLATIELPFIGGVLVAFLVAAVFAALVGVPLMRLSGAGAAIATFALLVIVEVVIRQWDTLTRGTSPLFGIPPKTTVWVAYTAVVVAILVAFAFRTSMTGLQLQASREDERAAGAMGVNVVRARVIAFALSAGITGVGGVLWAHFITAFSVHAFGFAATFTVLMMLIIGGMRTVTGAVVGAVSISLILRMLRTVESGMEIGAVELGPFHGLAQLALALLLLLILIYRPQGLMGDRELLPGFYRLLRNV
jgi:branched-chain amino acid transport system permease protein